MRAGVRFAGLIAVGTAVIAGPASAKPSITEATITGPGIQGEIEIEPHHTEALWEYGIDGQGGLGDVQADPVEALGLTPSDLGRRYLVTYRFGFRDDITQDLYPYAEGGPVTYTPPKQNLTGLFGHGGYMRVDPGWHRSSSSGFLRYLVERGLPENPVAAVADGSVDSGTASEAHRRTWLAFLVVLGGLTALLVAAPAVRRRVVAVVQEGR